jgi:hypothetical protein
MAGVGRKGKEKGRKLPVVSETGVGDQGSAGRALSGGFFAGLASLARDDLGFR